MHSTTGVQMRAPFRSRCAGNMFKPCPRSKRFMRFARITGQPLPSIGIWTTGIITSVVASNAPPSFCGAREAHLIIGTTAMVGSWESGSDGQPMYEDMPSKEAISSPSRTLPRRLRNWDRSSQPGNNISFRAVFLAPADGFEPPFTGPKPVVLPLDEAGNARLGGDG